MKAYKTTLLKFVTALGLITAIGIQACDSPLSVRGGGPAVVLETGTPENHAAKKPPVVNKPVSGDVLIAGGVDSKLKSDAHAEFYNPTTKKFVATGPLSEDRAGVVGVESSGKIIVFSGINGDATINHMKGQLRVVANVRDNAEVYNPTTGSFAITTSNNPTVGVAFYTATPLNDGTILVAGGLDGTYTPTSAAEIYDPNMGTFTAVGSMNFARAYHTATLLPDNTVLIVGGSLDALGDTEPSCTDTGAEIYDPIAKTFTRTTQSLPTLGGSANLGIAAQTATLLPPSTGHPKGLVLIAGGYNNFGDSTVTSVTNNGILYDPAAQTFTATTGVLNDARAFHTATLLSSGQVLLAGGLADQAIPVANGVNGIFGGIINSAELYDPASQKFTCIGGPINIKNFGPACKGVMANSRAGHSATLFTVGPLAGEVLLAGGVGGKARTTKGAGAPLATAELYSPATDKFTATGKMITARALFAATLLQ